MKITNYLTILFSVVAIFLLLGLAGYITYVNTDDSDPIKQQVTDVLDKVLPEELSEKTLPAASPAPVTETEKETETEITTTEQTLAAHDFIFVGDSRTLGMRDAVKDNCTYIGAEGEGYRWFASDGITELRTALENDPSRKVIINLGINDPENMEVYLDFYHNLSSEFSDTPFYFMSVNPLGKDADFDIVNDEIIKDFNASLKDEFPENFLDCYSYLKENGFETVDELHYTENTYKDIHRFVVDQLS